MLCLESAVFPLAAAWSNSIFGTPGSQSRVCVCASSKDFPASQCWHQRVLVVLASVSGAFEILVGALAHVSTSTSFVPVGADRELSPRLSTTSIPRNVRTHVYGSLHAVGHGRCCCQVGPNTAYLPIAARSRTNVTGLSQSATWKLTMVSFPCMPLKNTFN